MTQETQLRLSLGKGIAARGGAASRKPRSQRWAARSSAPATRMAIEDEGPARTNAAYATVGGDRFFQGMRLDD